MGLVTRPAGRGPLPQPVGLPLPLPSGPQGRFLGPGRMYARQRQWEPHPKPSHDLNRNKGVEMRTVSGSDTTLGRWAVDEVFERYVSWLQECHAVRLAYQRWVDSSRAEARLAYAGYVAALDREEHAARAYASHIER